MRKRLTLGAAVLAAIAVPGAVLAGGAAEPFETDLATVGGQTTWSTESAKTNSRSFKPVPGLERWADEILAYDPGTAIHVSVDLRGGRGKLRVREGGSDGQIGPGSVLLTGKGVATAIFLLRTGFLDDPVVQWRKLGDDKLRARSVVVEVVGKID
jgi:hypothetical protein